MIFNIPLWYASYSYHCNGVFGKIESDRWYHSTINERDGYFSQVSYPLDDPHEAMDKYVCRIGNDKSPRTSWFSWFTRPGPPL